MILIFGGSYQGKLDYARQLESFDENEIFFCGKEASLDLSKKIIYGLENFVFGCVYEKKEAKEILMENQKLIEDKIIILSDISQGIVPMDPLEREWREMNGRTMLYLGQQADKVFRVFCGLGQRIK